LLVLLAALVLALPFPPAARAGLSPEDEPADPIVLVRTSEGSFAVELYPRRAPQTVSLFLARAGLVDRPGDEPPLATYAGTVVCESRAGSHLVLGCRPETSGWPAPRAAGLGPPQPDEIDGVALGLGERSLDDPAERHWLWQQEIFPRYVELRQGDRPVPPGLARLVEGVREHGMAATSRLEGRTRLWYLEALGYRYLPGASELPVERGALATANLWPGEADERFLIALADLPARSGRATVFGRVIEGWEVLEGIERVPVDKSHRPRRRIAIAGMRNLREPDPGVGTAGGKDDAP
jgi:cyclophilin family peptidyl-prolyl cis-trans isomerase